MIRWIGLPVAIGLAVLLAMPVWFSWLLGPVLSKFEIHYSSYTRMGYGRFALENLVCDLDAARFTANRIELQTPPAWLWRLGFGEPQDSTAFISLTGWHLELKPQPASEPPSPPPSLPELRLKAATGFEQVQKWIPTVLISDGIIVAGSQEIAVTKIALRHSQISVATDAPPIAKGATVNLDFRNPNLVTLNAELPTLNLSASTTITGTESDLDVKGVVLIQENTIEWSALFERGSTIPTRAELACAEIRLPSRFLDGTQLANAKGDLTLIWQNNQLNLNLNTEVDATLSEGAVHESLQTSIVAVRDQGFISINEFRMRAPWLEFQSLNPARFDLASNRLAAPVAIRIAANLQDQRWFDAEGSVTGELRVLPRAEAIPEVVLDLTGNALGAAGIDGAILSTQTALVWPRLEIATLEMRLPDDTTAHLSAEIDLKDLTIRNGIVKLEGQVPRDFLPETISCGTILLSGAFAGPIQTLIHSGQLKVQSLALPQLQPLEIESEWNGTFLDIRDLHVAVSSKTSTLTTRGALSSSDGQFTLQVLSLDLLRGTERILGLTETASIRIGPILNAPGQENDWKIELTPLQFAGGNTSISVQADSAFPTKGKFEINVTGLDASLSEGFLPTPPPKVQLDHLALLGGWTNGPVVFQLDSSVSVPMDGTLALSARLRANGHSNGIEITSLEVSDKSGMIAEGQGTVPLTLTVARDAPLMHFDADKALSIQIATKPNAPFWSQLSKGTGLTLLQPAVALEIGGTIHAPEARLGIAAESVALAPSAATSEIPPLTHLRARLELNSRNLKLSDFSISLQDQPLTASAELPVNLEATNLTERLEWRKARGRIDLHDADLSQIARVFPNQLSPQGTLNFALEVLPDLQMNGALTIKDAASRPLPSIGSVQEIYGDVLFQEQQVVIKTLRGSIGGSAVDLTGTIDLEEEHRRSDGLPLLDLRIQSENTPLVRRPDLVLRSDLDLAISNTTNGHPVISGVVRLRESFFLSDVQALQPGKVRTPSQRPPYFSVDAAPLKDWLLSLKVEGDRFMRIQTPVFEGRASTVLTLENTLAEPIALGEVTLNEGAIQFPFAKLQIKQGYISLTSANPYEPQLLINAESPVFGYDVKMEVTGSANDPAMELSSTPSLSSEQIMLMMTAGELPNRELTFTRQQKATRMGMFLGKGLLSRFGSGSGSADRLTIRSGEHISSEGKQTYSVEYRLTDHWSVVGEYDRFSQFNADLKWRFYSR